MMEVLIKEGINIHRMDSPIANKEITVLDYLKNRKCSTGPRSERSNELKRKYERLTKILISSGVKESKVTFKSLRFGKEKE